MPKTWESAGEWRPSRLATGGAGWVLARAPHFSPLPAAFLPKDSAHIRPGTLLVRDGLFPLVEFFTRHTAPPRGFATRLLIHADWAAFIPARWRRHCRNYRIGHRAHPELLRKPLAARARRKAVFALELAPQYCPLPRLEAIVARAPKVEAAGIFEHGPGTFEHELGAIELLRGLAGRAPDVVPEAELRYFLDLRSSLVLDLNARYLCADDANLHLCLARGAIDPLAGNPGRGAVAFHRISSFHGYFELPLPRQTGLFWRARGPAFEALRATAARRRRGGAKHPLEPWTELLERYRLSFGTNVF